MSNKVIVHIAAIDISCESGMGRVAWHWRKAFEERGYEFFHVGKSEVGSLYHYSLFPLAAYHYAKKYIKQTPSLFLVHEPASGSFMNQDIPTVVFSHGLERRSWELRCQGKDGSTEKIKLRTQLFTPLLLRHSEQALKKAEKLLLINSEDMIFAQKVYQRRDENLFAFKNGINPSRLTEENQPKDQAHCNVLFLGSWLERKGTHTLVNSAKILYEKEIDLCWTLAGVGNSKKTVIDFWPKNLHDSVRVIPQFLSHQEQALLADANIFVLPSFFEGQPLALLQAMESGRCCITTNCCGQRDLIQHEYNGLLFEPGDAKALARLIEQCVKDRELRLRLGRNARLSVHNRQWESVASEVVDQVEQVITKDLAGKYRS